MMLKATRDAMGDYSKNSSLPHNFYSESSSSSSDDDREDEVSEIHDQVRRSMMRYGVDARKKNVRISQII